MEKLTKVQKTRVTKNAKYANQPESSPYWDDYNARRGDDKDEKLNEHLAANPDMLAETEIAALSTPQLLMGEAIEHLQGRQREVYILLMREDKTFEEAAEILGVTKGSVQKYKERAIRFVTQYCENAIKKGRV